MGSSYGENIKLTIFGQSHSPAIGMTLEGIPAGHKIDMAALNAFLARRAPGNNELSTPRKEADEPEFLSGMRDDVTCGVPITAVIRNTNTHSSDYSELKVKPRPGHADYTAEIKYGGSQDFAGGGHFSGRLTAPMCIAGGIALQLLAREGIHVLSRIYSIGGIRDNGELNGDMSGKAFPVVDDAQGMLMKQLILDKKAEADSVGGVIECKVTGLPAGLGDPMFSGMENRIAQIVFGIPAVKGLEFGAGFDVANMAGSECNDDFCLRDGHIETVTNNCGGILGGITDGMPLIFRAAFKPTPSIGKEQRTVDLSTMEETVLRVHGRHDPCIVPRAVPVVEAAAALAVYDALLGRRKEVR
ncbi:MAG: chorismate synthase [Lachnospiraceae bacterium]|nr:chorismate synthase [Lachnospiraceae bacterium]